MASTPIGKLTQYNRLKRIGEENTGEDPFTESDSLGVPDSPRLKLSRLASIAEASKESEPSIEDLIGTFDHTAQDKYDRLISDRPTREGPSLMRAIVAGGMGLKSNDPFKTEEEVMYAPYNRKKADWAAEIEPAYKSAQLENTANANDRLARVSQINARVAADKLIAHERETQANNASREKIANDKNDLAREIANGANVDLKGEYAIVTRKDGTVYNSGVPTTAFNPMERAELQARTQVQVANIGATSREKVAETLKPQILNIPDPNDPTKTITVQTVPGTPTAAPVTVGGSQVGPASRPGSGSGKALVQPTNLKDIQAFTQETLNGLNDLIDEKGNLTGPAKAYYGFGAGVGMGKIMLTDAKTGQARHKHVMGELVLDLIGRLKNQSRTGATGFGQLSGPELAILESAANGIDPAEKPEETVRKLKQIREKLKKILLPPDGSTPTITQPRNKVQIAIDEALGGK